MADRRVVITGLGVVGSAGIGMQDTWNALVEGKKCTKTIDLFDASSFPANVAGQIDNFSARDYVPKNYRKAVKVMARDIEIAVAAADFAFKDAQLATRADGEMAMNSRRLGCNIGAGLIACNLDELGIAAISAQTDGKFDLTKWGKEGLMNLTPLWLLKYLPNMLSCHVTIIHGAEGPSNCITCGCASGILSISEAARWILRNTADAAVAGGAESKLNQMGLLRAHLLNRLTTECNDNPEQACKPFDAQHSGTVLGEGGGLLILEEMQFAKDRGSKIYAELVGFGAACDPEGYDVTKPSCGGLDLAVKNAIRQAGIDPSQVGLICTHGTGVPGEDTLECRAWKNVFGENLKNIPALALMGATGQMLAGTSGFAAAVTAKCVEQQKVPLSVNFNTPFEECELNLQKQTVDADIEYAVCGTFSVGGQSAACVIKRV